MSHKRQKGTWNPLAACTTTPEGKAKHAVEERAMKRKQHVQFLMLVLGEGLRLRYGTPEQDGLAQRMFGEVFAQAGVKASSRGARGRANWQVDVRPQVGSQRNLEIHLAKLQGECYSHGIHVRASFINLALHKPPAMSRGSCWWLTGWSCTTTTSSTSSAPSTGRARAAAGRRGPPRGALASLLCFAPGRQSPALSLKLDRSGTVQAQRESGESRL